MQAPPLTVLFDLDGTLIDSIALIIQAAHYAFDLHDGPRPTEQEFVAGIGRPLVTQFGPYVRSPEEMATLIANYRTYQLEHHDRLTTLYDGVEDSVVALRSAGHRLGIVTSKMEGIARRSLGHVRLDHHFEVLVGCDATERHKPDPQPVHFALERMGGVPERAVFVGDSPYDLQAGNSAGVTTIAATWGAFPRDTLLAAAPSYVAHRPQEIPDLIDAIWRRGPA
ncbi:MAG: HAD-IA family hydrolase [Gemmatimonadaceae bacterium]